MSEHTARRDPVNHEYSEGRKHGRTPNAAAFIGPLWAWGPGLALFGTALAMLGHRPVWVWHESDPRIAIPLGLGDESARATISIMLPITAVALTIIAIAYALPVVKRHPVVVCHLVGSIWVAWFMLQMTSQAGWSLTWGIIHGFMSIIGGGGWAFLRTDALRKDPRKDGDAKSDGGIREAVGVATSAVNRKSIEQTPFGAKFTVELGAKETIKTITEALPHLAREAHAVPNMSFISQGADASRVDVNLVTINPFDDWRPWPGLMHPGGSYVESFRTSYYVTGEEMIYYFAAKRGRIKPRQATGMIRMGTTRAGKSGDSDIELAEALSRRDAVVVAIVIKKFNQNLGWCKQYLSLAAETVQKARILEAGIWRLVDYRVAQMSGDDDDRDWSPDVYKKYGFTAVHFYYDEADKVLGRLAEKIATTALSVGVFMSASLPAADHKSMPVAIRRSLGIRKCFGTADSYSADFVLTDETRAIAPDPFEWGVDYPGAHLMDRATGVERRLWSVPGRSYYAGHGELAAAVAAARRTFTPATFTPGEIEALGEAFTVCQPGRVGVDDTPAGGVRGNGVTGVTTDPVTGVTTDPVTGVTGVTADPVTGAPTIDAATIQAALALLAERGESPTEHNLMIAIGLVSERRERQPASGRGNTSRADVRTDMATDDLGRLSDEGDDMDDMDTDDDVIDYDDPDDDDQFEVRIGPPGPMEGLDGSDLADLASIDARTHADMRRTPGDAIELDDGVPRAKTQAEADAELDRAITILVVEQGKREFASGEVLALCRLWDDAKMSRRLKAISDPQLPDWIAPPGIKLRRLRRGRWGADYTPMPVSSGSNHGA
jgi:hypothetical protein